MKSGLQHALDGFASACNIAGTKIGTSKTEVLHLSRSLVRPMFSASWQSVIEAGGEVQVRSWGHIHESWKARQNIGCSIRQRMCCNASFTLFSRLKTGAIEKGKSLRV